MSRNDQLLIGEDRGDASIKLPECFLSVVATPYQFAVKGSDQLTLTAPAGSAVWNRDD